MVLPQVGATFRENSYPSEVGVAVWQGQTRTMAGTTKSLRQRETMNGLLESILVSALMVAMELLMRALIRHFRPIPLAV
jgi:hypothetical protein